MKQALKLGNIQEIDNGRIEAAFNQALKTVVKDCLDRPGDVSARSVTMKLIVRPVKAADGICEDLDVEFKIDPKIPARHSKTYRVQPHPTGTALINPASDKDPHQNTLDEIAGQ